MLIQHKGVYGHVLPPDEARLYMAEKEYKANDRYRLTGHEGMKAGWKKRGHMHASEFILRVKRCNPGLFVQQQVNFPDNWGLYADVRGNLTYVTQFNKGWVPEYCSITVDGKDLADGQVRGWRECLVRLMNWGFMTWEQVMGEFWDAPGDGGAKWRKQTMLNRNGASDRIWARNRKNKLNFGSIR